MALSGLAASTAAGNVEQPTMSGSEVAPTADPASAAIPAPKIVNERRECEISLDQDLQRPSGE
jgi:hypothetical protein